MTRTQVAVMDRVACCKRGELPVLFTSLRDPAGADVAARHCDHHTTPRSLDAEERVRDHGAVVTVRGAVRSERITRAGVVTGEVMALSAGAHAVAGGDLPSLGWLASVSAVVMAVSMAVLRGSVGMRSAISAIAVLQIGLHLAFQVTAAYGHAGHTMSMDQGLLHLSLPMMVAHLVTTGAAGLVLSIQARAVARAREWFNAWCRGGSLAPIPSTSGMPVAGTHRLGGRRMLLLLRSPRRGPPAVSSVAP